MLSAASGLLRGKGDLAFRPAQSWSSVHRNLFIWSCIAAFPISQLKAEFASFREPVAFHKFL